MKQRKAGRPRKGKERSVSTSIRLEPKTRRYIKRQWGTVQNFVDSMIDIYSR